jgi:type II secretory pathway component PulC
MNINIGADKTECNNFKMMKSILILLALALSAYAESPYEAIAERNAFNLTGKKPTPTLPSVKEILAPTIFLTGITRIDGIRKVHFVLRKAGDQDKFVSLATNEKQYNVELKKILNDSAYISNNGETNLLNFKTNSLPTMIAKAAPKLMIRSSSSKGKDSKTSDSEKREAMLRKIESYRSRGKK